MIINALLGITTIIFNSISASVGNLNTGTNAKQKKKIFEEITLICFGIIGSISICLVNGLNDFIQLWLGSEYVLSYNILIMIVANYYIYGTLKPIWVYRSTTGIFKDVRKESIILIILNLILSIILGYFLGIFGIIAGTIISRLVTSYWYEPYVLYKKIFKSSIKIYYIKQIRNILILVVAYIVILPIISIFKDVTIFNLLVKMIISFVLGIIIMLVFTYKDKETLEIISRIKQILSKIKN